MLHCAASSQVRAFLTALVCLSAVAVSHAQSGADKTGSAVEPLPVEVSPLDEHLRYIGRFDTSDPVGPRCDWSASTVTLAFEGSALNVRLKEDSGNNEYEVVVDGSSTGQIITKSGANLYSVFHADKSGTHTVALVKRTEAFCGVTQFQGFQLSDGGKLLSLPAPAKHRIEVVGDSISCGYGNEGKDKSEHFSSTTENAYLTYGAITARNFGADYICTAWSGRKMWPDNTMGAIYDRALATDAGSTWDFARWTPDVVVVTLATNDFGRGAPDEKGWIAGYEAFLARVHTHYPKAAIYCATSPMMSGEPTATLRSYLSQIIADQQAAGYKNVRLLEFETQDIANGFGSDWHPSVKTQQIMAEKMSQAFEQDLGWKRVAK